MWSLVLHCGSRGWQQVGDKTPTLDPLIIRMAEMRAEYPRWHLYFGFREERNEIRPDPD